MVSEFNTLAFNQGLSPSEMHAYVGNLISPSPSEEFKDEKFYDFDIAVVGLGFHHFDDPKLATERLAKRLKRGGVLMIIDFLPHESFDGHSHGHSHGPGHQHGEKKKKDDDDEHAVVMTQKEMTSAQHTVSHHGFKLEDVKSMFENAGVGKEFEAVELGDGVVFARSDGQETRQDFKRSVFMARGFKE